MIAGSGAAGGLSTSALVGDAHPTNYSTDACVPLLLSCGESTRSAEQPLLKSSGVLYFSIQFLMSSLPDLPSSFFLSGPILHKSNPSR